MKYTDELKDAIKKAIEKAYGKIDDSGCYCNGKWMSTENIFKLISNVIDDNDYMLKEMFVE